VIGAFSRDSSVVSWLCMSAELKELIVVIDTPEGFPFASGQPAEPPAGLTQSRPPALPPAWPQA
jgi:hypothetical protein